MFRSVQFLVKTADRSWNVSVSAVELHETGVKSGELASFFSFVEVGGWDLLNDWLQEAKSMESQTFLTELLKLYQTLPVTVDLLKKNSCAKTIKTLSKNSDKSEFQLPNE